MANTPNLNLVKPGLDDDALITDINNNMDKIDTGFGSLSDQITTNGYNATVNGITYYMYETLGNVIISATAGTLTNAISAGAVIVNLSDFSASLSGKKFAFTVFAPVINISDARVVSNGGASTVQVSQSHATGANIRFTLVGYIS